METNEIRHPIVSAQNNTRHNDTMYCNVLELIDDYY